VVIEENNLSYRIREMETVCCFTNEREREHLSTECMSCYLETQEGDIQEVGIYLQTDVISTTGRWGATITNVQSNSTSHVSK